MSENRPQSGWDRSVKLLIPTGIVGVGGLFYFKYLRNRAIESSSHLSFEKVLEGVQNIAPPSVNIGIATPEIAKGDPVDFFIQCGHLFNEALNAAGDKFELMSQIAASTESHSHNIIDALSNLGEIDPSLAVVLSLVALVSIRGGYAVLTQRRR